MVWIVNVDLGMQWMKMLILVGFSDIRYDINIFGLKWVKRLILLGFIGFFYLGVLGVLKLSLCRDKPAYRLPVKQNICSSFYYPPLQNVGFFPFYRKQNTCFDFENWTIRSEYNRTFV